MMRISQNVAFVPAIFAGVLAVGLTGCPGPAGPATESDDHAVPTTLAQAREELEHMGEEIKQAFESGKPEEAHDALHDIGHVIKALPALAKTFGVAAEDEVKQVHDDLMDSFAKLDAGMHDGEEAAWSDVSEKIDAAMAKLKSWLPEGDGRDNDGENHTDHEPAVGAGG